MQDPAHVPIEIDQLRKTFGDQSVLKGVTLRVAPEETVAVLGRSGTGKSVLLKILIRLLPSDSGTVKIAGEDISRLNASTLNQLRKKIGFLFQQAALYDSMTVRENVAFPLTMHADLSASDQEARVRELLASVQMDQEGDKLPSQISGGMQKRIGLARALALDPEILLFDEPTAGLDPITADEIGQLILQLKRERKVSAVVVTHDVRSARVFADRFVLLHQGNFVADGTFADLQRSREPFVKSFLRNGP